MDEWLALLKTNSNSQTGLDVQRILSGQHTWCATSHARPIYCNVCRDQLSGVTSHGLSCEICKFKVHRRCAAKAISNCKWTTLASVGKDIIEDKYGNILMPHQWMEGNLPVSAKCIFCDRTCGSMKRLQDWRCLWCRASIHTGCRPKYSIRCPLGPNYVSVVPPTAIHSTGIDDAWEAVRPHGCSPLLVFVNSKSGDNQGVKFLRRFRQILNPAQVFDLITSGPTLGLKLFHNFDPFRVLVCSGDGSVGWVLSEIDRLNMQLQCEVGVLPLGTGNDLARILGWGASCDDETQIPQLLERYERASPKMLDRWSIMVYERSIKVENGGKLTLNTGLMKNHVFSTATNYEDTVLAHLTKILQSDQENVALSSAKVLCETVKDFISKVSDVTLVQGDDDFCEKCEMLKLKLDHLLNILREEQMKADTMATWGSNSCSQSSTNISGNFVSEEQEKSWIPNKVKEKNESRRDQLLLRVNSLKKAVRCLIEYTEKAVDEQRFSSGLFPSSPSGKSAISAMSTTILKESYTTEGSESMVSPTINVPNVTSISPLPEIRRDSSCSTDIHLVSLPVPKEFADSRHGSFADPNNEKSVFSLGCCVENAMFIYESKDVRSEKLSKMYSDSEEEDEKRLRRRNDNAKEDSDGEKQNEEDDEESEYGENLESKLEDEAFFGKHVDSLDGEFNLSEKKFVGSLSEEFANIGHIDSSETSDDSPEAFTKSKEGDDHANTKIRSIARSSLRESIKESEFNFQSSIDGVCNFGSELDMTNLFSTSPEEEEECSEEYKREMGLELAKRCSIAHFIEGSDIARKSIKCRHRKKSFDDLDLECVAVAPEIGNQCPLTDGAVDVPRIRVLNEDNSSICILPVKNQMNIQIRISGDNISNINDLLSDNDLKPDRRSCTLSLTDDEECVRFEGLKKDEPITNSTSTGPTVIIDPPSPTHRREDDDDAPSVDIDTKPSHEAIRRLSGNCRRLSAASPLVSGHCSPIPTRRISNISPVPPFDSLDQKDKHSNAGDKSTQQKALPIINPLVRLPQWPNVVTEHGIIGKVLLANADALCAAAVPLMDPDETLMEGFFERCVMNNYFGIGIDAKISLDFHHKREEHPEKCRSRTRNYMWYGVLGSKQWLQKTCKNLEQRVQLECDGQRIPLPSLQGIVVLNIPSFMGGINFWGGTKEDDVFLAPSIDDHILEVVAVFGTVQMAASRLINLQHHRIAQCNTVQISILGEEGVPIQVDGEAWIQPPGMIRIIHKNRMKMLCRNKGLESSLKAWEEKQRQIRHQNRLHSTSGKLTALTEDEMNILLGFIESLTSLIKYVKMLIIRDPSIEADLYQLAAAVGINLERVHPKGKILQGLELRPVVTELVVNAQRLVEETNAVLRDKNIQTASEMERQLNSSIQNMVMELKKCEFFGSPQHSLVYFRMLSPDDERRAPTGRKSSAGAFWQRFRRNSGISSIKYSRREVTAWEVGDVATWLESIQLGEYADSFSSNDVRGRELLALTRTDLKELGVSKVGHVKRLLLAIKEFAA